MNEQNIIQRISVSKDNLTKIAEKFGCTKTTVYNALAGRTKTERSQKIRDIAVRKYGGRISTIQSFI